MLSNQEILNGLTRCRQEIKNLREVNKVLKLELNAMNKVLSAVNGNSSKSGEGIARCADYLIRDIDNIIDQLAKRVEIEQSKEPQRQEDNQPYGAAL